MKSKEELKKYFENGDKPDQEQFWEWQDSYWHKDEKIPADSVDDLSTKADLINGKVPASQLPSYVDDILEFDTFENLPNPGEKGKIYLVTNDNSQFRWSDSGYIQLNSDEFLMTTNTNQDVNAIKRFFNSNNGTDTTFQLWAVNGAKAGIFFYSSGMDTGLMNFDGYFHFKSQDDIGYRNIKANGYIKNGYGNDFVLLAGSGAKALNEFALANDLNYVHKIDTTYGLNNASDTHTNKSWFDYNWAGQGKLGSVINVSGFGGTDQKYNTEIFAAYNSNYAAIRSKNGDINTWNEPMVLWHDKNFNPDTKVNSLENAKAIGFRSGQLPTANGTEYPYVYYDNGVTTAYIALATQEFVNYKLGNYVTLNTPQTIIAAKDFAPTSTVTFLGNEANYTQTYNISGAINSIVAGFIHKFYGVQWRTGLKRGSNANSLGYSFEFSENDGTSYQQALLIEPNSNLVTSNFGDSNEWNQAYNWGNHATAGYASESWISNRFTRNEDNVRGLAFDSGSAFGVPYFIHSDGTYVPMATQAWINANFPNQTLSTGVEGLGGQTLTLSNGNAVTITNNFVTSPDGTRNPDDIKPNTSGNRVRFDFAHASLVKCSGNYAGVMTYAPWDGTTASTGDSSYQLAFANQTGINGEGIPMLKLRKGIDEKWSSDWYKMWSEGDFSQSDINNWNKTANTAATQSWVESQDYASHSFVEEKLNQFAVEHINPDYPIVAESKINTIIITEEFRPRYLELASEFIPERHITVTNLASFDISVRREDDLIDRILSGETTEYYITSEKKLIKKGFYRGASLLV